MLCPTCHSENCRRSRRSGFEDRVLGLTGLRPWRCRTCETRFHAWVAPARFILYVQCPSCGNLDLKTVSRDRVVEGWLRWLYRLLRVRAYRCDGCRTRFFSLRRFHPIRPTVPRESTETPAPTSGATAA